MAHNFSANNGLENFELKEPINVHNRPANDANANHDGGAGFAFAFWSYDAAKEAADAILSLAPPDFAPDVALICGSGCGVVADRLSDAVRVNYSDVPYFMSTAVPGHKGCIVMGKLGDKSVVAMQGRYHAYEGYHYGECAFPVRVMRLMGARKLIVTLACGGLNQDFEVGDFMIIKDHISFPVMSGFNPLKGPNDERFGPRFVALNNAYDSALRKHALASASRLHFRSPRPLNDSPRSTFVHEGVLVQASGPSFETPSECSFYRNIGGDAIGMSNCHEVIVARHAGMKVLSIAFITNKAVLDVDDDKVTNHEEVLEAGKNSGENLAKLILDIVRSL